MSTYNRTTRECLVSQLRPELHQAIRNYFQDQHLGDPGTEALACCETTSKRKSTGWLDSWLSGEQQDTTLYTAMLLTPQMLIWVRSADSSGVVLAAAHLTEIQVRAYTSLLAQDTGLEVSGYVGDSKSRIRGYIGMGPEVAAQKFCDEVKQAVAKVNPQTQKSLLKWLTG